YFNVSVTQQYVVYDSKDLRQIPNSLSQEYGGVIEADGFIWIPWYFQSIPLVSVSWEGPYIEGESQVYYATAYYSGPLEYHAIVGYTGTATYSGTVSRSEFSHYSGIATYYGYLSTTTTDGYYGEGNYQGTVYKSVPDRFEPEWRMDAKKYILYVADDHGMNDLDKLKDYQEKSGAKVIYIGPSDYSGAVKNIRYSSLADNIEEALEFIAVEEALETRDAVLINEEPFTLEVEDDDPENDTIVERAFKYEHDPNVYFNPEGQSSLPSTWSTYRAAMLDKPGKYVISYRVKDQVSEEPNFEEYNKYSNIAQVVLFGHRRPVVTDFNVNFEYNPATRKYENPDFLVSAYDPDYYDINNFRGRADKGIKEYAYEWKKKNESEFKYGIPNSLDAGTYVFKVMARDIDDAWSLPFEKEVVLSEMEFILKGLFEPEDAKFNPAVGIPASEQLRVRYIETIHAYPVNSVEFSLYQGGSSRTPVRKITNPADVIAVDKALIQWEPIRFYQIPETLPDGSYVATLTAKTNNASTSLRWNMQVVTPVDLQINVPAELYTDESNRITATTSKYVNKVTMLFDSNTYNMSLVDTEGDTKTWQYDLFLPEGYTLGEYIVSITATTSNGNSETKTAQVLVEDPLAVIGDSDKDTYMAGQAMLLTAYSEGRAYSVEAKVWFKNKHTNTDVTELIPERFLGDPPEKEMEWRTRRFKDDPGGRDLVVIIPPEMPDGTYQVEFTAYKMTSDGRIKTAHDTITVKVKGVVYDKSYSEIIGEGF
ncbi:MAG: hypothetical protein GX294_07400, partial [Candidatus Cloacimonetes bacterium]|nr:hypothetical protein [Candidatus Cloacimonadota bacterium]